MPPPPSPPPPSPPPSPPPPSPPPSPPPPAIIIDVAPVGGSCPDGRSCVSLEQGLQELRENIYLHANITEVRINPGYYTSENSGGTSSGAGRRQLAAIDPSYLTFDGSMFAGGGGMTQTPSDVRITGEPGSVLDGSLARGNSHFFKIMGDMPLLTSFNGLTFENFDTVSAFTVEGSSASIVGCNFTNNPKGAVEITGGMLTITQSEFAGNGEPTAQGGAVKVSGGQLEISSSVFTSNTGNEGGAIYASAGNVTLRSSTLTKNFARNVGGALSVAGTGDITLTDETEILTDNTVSLNGTGSAAYLTTGSIQYELPAPLGRWVSAVECKLYRLPCTTAGCDPNLMPALPTQPCQPHEYGKWLARFDAGPSNDGIPFRCAAGLLGQTMNPAEQATSSCTRACRPGYYCPAGSFEETVCRTGTYCPRASPYEMPCIGGTYGVDKYFDSDGNVSHGLISQSECDNCPPGFWCTSGSRIACGRDTFNPDPLHPGPAEQACRDCPQYSSTSGENSTSADDCQCDTGFIPVPAVNITATPYQPFTCQCSEGTGFNEAAQTCDRCDRGSYKDTQDNVVCTFCPVAFSTTNDLGATSEFDCLCLGSSAESSGYYLWADTLNPRVRTCESCPTGVDCNQTGNTLYDLPLLPNYWREPQHEIATNVTEWAHEVRPCPILESCMGGRDPLVQCAVGQTGPLCAVCDDGYYGGNPKKGLLCTKCEGDPTLTIGAGAGFFSLILLIALYLLATGKWRSVLAFMMTLNITFKVQRGAKKVKLAVKQDKRKKAGCCARFVNWAVGSVMYVVGMIKRQQVKMKIIVSLLQVMNGVGATVEIRYPSSIKNAVDVSNYLELDAPSFMPLQCIFPWINFCHKLIIQTAYPWVFVAFFRFASTRLKKGADDDEKKLVAEQTARLKPKQIDAGEKDPWETVDGFRRVADLFDDLSFFLLFLLYPGASAQVTSFFVCDEFDGLGESGARYLKADLSVDCDGALWYAVLPYVLVMVAMYPIGTPMIFYSILFQNRDLLHEMQRTELLASASKKSIKSMENLVLAHNGHEALEKFQERQAEIAAASVRRFAKLKAKPVDTKDILAKVAEEAKDYKPKEVPTDLNEIVKRAILKIQAKARGAKVRSEMRQKQVDLDNAKLENDRLFASEYATISQEIENAANLDKRLQDLMQRMPSTVQKLVVGYEYRVYWFEIFECMRKLALTCLPQLLEPGSIDQLVVTLLMSFCTFSMYVAYAPYEDDDNDQLSIVCQSIIFFTLLSGVVMACSTSASYVDILLPVCIVVPLLYVVFVKTGLAALWTSLKKKYGSKKKGQGRFTLWLDRLLGTPVKYATATMEVPKPKGPAKLAPSKADKAAAGGVAMESTTSTQRPADLDDIKTDLDA